MEMKKHFMRYLLLGMVFVVLFLVNSGETSFAEDDTYCYVTFKPNGAKLGQFDGAAFTGKYEVKDSKCPYNKGDPITVINYKDAPGPMIGLRILSGSHKGTLLKTREEFDAFLVTEDITVEYVWDADVFYTLTMDPNGGVISSVQDGAKKTTVKVKRGSSYSLPIVKKTGYKLAGWLVKNGENKGDYYEDQSSISLSEDVLLQALWINKNVKVGWYKSSGKWYYNNFMGEMQYGWVKISGKWYYFESDGAMKTGWLEYEGRWYFLNPSGDMQIGWRKINNKWYYFAPSGTLYYGWKRIGSDWYYLNKSGYMQTGWKKISGDWYYFKADGVMVDGRWVIGKKLYTFAEGAWVEKPKAVKIGESIMMGAYEQDNKTSNGKESIEWIVIDKSGEKLMLLSKYALDCKYFNNKPENCLWENSSVRAWLNNTFIKKAFTSAERSLIQTTTVVADDNKKYNTDAGNDTNDKIFLLSVSELERYFKKMSDRECHPTAYTIAQGAYNAGSLYDTGTVCFWWLRTPGESPDATVLVMADGSTEYCGYWAASLLDGNNTCYPSVRPAMWITP